eukprot:scaffold50070_cov112-Isochrysis_galbana.AAC.6
MDPPPARHLKYKLSGEKRTTLPRQAKRPITRGGDGLEPAEKAAAAGSTRGAPKVSHVCPDPIPPPCTELRSLVWRTGQQRRWRG